MTDVLTPGRLDGFMLVRWIRTNYPHRPVIVVSGHALEGHLAEVLLAGEAFFLKPYDERELLAKIRQLLARAAAMPPRRKMIRSKGSGDSSSFDLGAQLRQEASTDELGVGISLGLQLSSDGRDIWTGSGFSECESAFQCRHIVVHGQEPTGLARLHKSKV